MQAKKPKAPKPAAAEGAAPAAEKPKVRFLLAFMQILSRAEWHGLQAASEMCGYGAAGQEAEGSQG